LSAFSLCLSRAYLGKKSIFIYKRLQKTVFPSRLKRLRLKREKT
jgi:hypothetical protein